MANQLLDERRFVRRGVWIGALLGIPGPWIIWRVLMEFGVLDGWYIFFLMTIWSWLGPIIGAILGFLVVSGWLMGKRQSELNGE